MNLENKKLSDYKKIETKQVMAKDAFKSIYINESFGWRYISSTNVGENNLITFQRDLSNIKEYDQLITNETDYYNLEKADPPVINKFLLIFLFMLFIIPGLIYLLYFNWKKSNFEMNAQKTFWEKSKKLIWESRKLSFDSQSVMSIDFSKGNYKYVKENAFLNKENVNLVGAK